MYSEYPVKLNVVNFLCFGLQNGAGKVQYFFFFNKDSR